MSLNEQYIKTIKSYFENIKEDKKKHRKKALEMLLEKGFPGVKDEEWKYTNPNKLIKDELLPAATDDNPDLNALKKELNKNIVNELNPRIVFLDGFLNEEMSNIKDIKDVLFHKSVAVFKEVDEHDGFNLLNQALFNDALQLIINKDYDANQLIEIHHIYLKSEQLKQSRVDIIMNSFSSASIYETSIDLSQKKQFINNYTNISVQENAILNYYKVQDYHQHTNCIDSIDITQTKNSNYTIVTISIDGGIIRNNVIGNVDGQGAEANLFSLYYPNKDQHFDNKTIIKHNTPNCNSNQLYKGLLEGNSTAIFNGKIVVDQLAQKTNAFQSNKNLLLDNNATINSKPQLMIYADDVKCSHGATSSQIDEEALFYLMSRGLKKDSAQALLTLAFGEEIIEKIKINEIKTKLEQRLALKLNIHLY